MSPLNRENSFYTVFLVPYKFTRLYETRNKNSDRWKKDSVTKSHLIVGEAETGDDAENTVIVSDIIVFIVNVCDVEILLQQTASMLRYRGRPQ